LGRRRRHLLLIRRRFAAVAQVPHAGDAGDDQDQRRRGDPRQAGSAVALRLGRRPRGDRARLGGSRRLGARGLHRRVGAGVALVLLLVALARAGLGLPGGLGIAAVLLVGRRPRAGADREELRAGRLLAAAFAALAL